MEDAVQSSTFFHRSSAYRHTCCAEVLALDRGHQPVASACTGRMRFKLSKNVTHSRKARVRSPWGDGSAFHIRECEP